MLLLRIYLGLFFFPHCTYRFSDLICAFPESRTCREVLEHAGRLQHEHYAVVIYFLWEEKMCEQPVALFSDDFVLCIKS